MLHLHEPLAPGPTMTALVMHPAPTVGTFHAAGDSTSYRFANRSLNWLAGRLDLRVAVSDDARELAERYFGGTYDMLFNGVEVERYRIAGVDRADRAHDHVLRPARAAQGARRAARTLWPSCPADVRCWVASDGPETAELQASFAGDPRIEWLGRLTDAEKIARLASADVFCAPSLRGESFGVVLIEAMAAGTPIVASDLPGYRRVARPDVDALLTAPGDTAALAAALKRVLADADLAGQSAGQRERTGRGVLDALARRALRASGTRTCATQAASEADGGRDGCPGSGMGPPYHGAVMTWLIVLIVIVVVVGARCPVPLQRPDQQAEPGRERLVPDRRAAQAPPRPDPQPGRDGQGLRRPRARDARRRRRRPATPPCSATGPVGDGAGREPDHRRRCVSSSPCPRPTPTSRPTRTSCRCRRSCRPPRAGWRTRGSSTTTPC